VLPSLGEYLYWLTISTRSTIRPVVSDQSPRLSSTQQSVLLSLGEYLYWWTISTRGYHPPSSQCCYHWVNTSAGGLLVPEGIIRQVVTVTTTGSIPLLVDY